MLPIHLARGVALILALTLSSGYAGDTFSGAGIRDQVARIPIGASIEIRLRDAPKLQGSLSARDETSLTAKTGEGANAKEERVAYDRIRSVKLRQRAHVARTIAWIAAGVVVGIVVIAVVLYAKVRNN
ncbi:MAG: hypothetical protein U0Q18_31640 [Bryobacteraceae bacterium]